jgi:hypothetical protein
MATVQKQPEAEMAAAEDVGKVHREGYACRLQLRELVYTLGVQCDRRLSLTALPALSVSHYPNDLVLEEPAGLPP